MHLTPFLIFRMLLPKRLSLPLKNWLYRESVRSSTQNLTVYALFVGERKGGTAKPQSWKIYAVLAARKTKFADIYKNLADNAGVGYVLHLTPGNRFLESGK